MSHGQSRLYTGATDLPLFIDFARAATLARAPQLVYAHAGDMVWRLYDAADSPDIRLWSDERGLAGFVAFEPPLTMDLDARGGLRPGDPLAEEMLAWAEDRWRKVATAGGAMVARAYAMLGEGTLSTTALDSDLPRIALLRQHGYEKVERHSLRFRRNLHTPIADSELPPGMRLRYAAEADIEERVDLHRDAWSVWGPSSVTVASYQHLRRAPLYDQELDVVLEAADGRLVSYCICWADPETGVGNFEPTGTRPQFAGRGLARATILEGLRRLRARGMHTALVSTASVNERAAALYPSCGFEFVEREHFYVKALT